MKKLPIAALIAGSLTLTACDDKEKNALIEQTQTQAQMIEQLNTQVDTLQKQVVDLAENQAVHVEPEVLFEKSETIKFDNKSPDSYAPESAEAKVSVKTLKTNMDWLTDLLVNELIRQFTAEGKVKIENKQQFVEYLQTLYADSVKEVKEFELIGMTTNFDVKYLGQRENIATFTIGYYGYSGGAHGMYSTQFLNIDLAKKALLDIDDVINPDQHDKLKELLWETYSPLLASPSAGVPGTAYRSRCGACDPNSDLNLLQSGQIVAKVKCVKRSGASAGLRRRRRRRPL